MPQFADFLPHGSGGGGGLQSLLLGPLKTTQSLLGTVTGSLNHLSGLANSVLSTTIDHSFEAGRNVLDTALPGLSLPDQSRLTDTLSRTVSQLTTAPLGVAAAVFGRPGEVNIPVATPTANGSPPPNPIGSVIDGLGQTAGTLLGFNPGSGAAGSPGRLVDGVTQAIGNLADGVGRALGETGSVVSRIGTDVVDAARAPASAVQNTAATVANLGRELSPTATVTPLTARGDVALVHDAVAGTSYFLATATARDAQPQTEQDPRKAPAPPPEDPRRLQMNVEVLGGIARFDLGELERATGRPLLLEMVALLRGTAAREAEGLVTAIAADRVLNPGEVPQGFVPQVKMRDDPFPYADVYTPSKPKDYVQSAADRDSERAAGLQDLLREAIRRFYAMRPPVGSIGDRLGFDSNGGFVQSLAHHEQQAIEIRVIRDQMRALGIQDAKMERLLLLQEHLSDHALEYSAA